MTTQIQHCSVRLRFFPIRTLWLLTLAVLVTAASPAMAQTYGGRAFSALVNAPTLGVGPLYLSDTGPLSSSGDWLGAGSLSENVPAILSADVMNATTSGLDGGASSIASLADIAVFSGQPAALTASFVSAQSQAGIGGGSATIQVFDLTFGGLPVTVTGLPNQVVSLPGVATLIINEQTISTDGNSAVVNALRLTLATGDQVTLASASSQVIPAGLTPLASLSISSCTSAASATTRATVTRKPRRIFPVWVNGGCIDFVTGGGFIEPPHSYTAGRANFGFNAGPRSVENQTLKGELNLIDHSTGDHVQGTTVDDYFPFSGDTDHCRTFTGDAKFNDASGYRYVATVCDYGEPGRDDRFVIHVTLGGSDVYFNDNFDPSKVPYKGDLPGGNIQLHKSKCPKTSSTSSSSSMTAF